MKQDFLDLQRAWIVPRKRPSQVNGLTWILLAVLAGLLVLGWFTP